MFATMLHLRTALCLFLVTGSAAGQPPAAVGTATSPAATFAARGPTGFRVLPASAPLAAGELLVTLPGAALTCGSGLVAVKSLGDYDARSPLPVLETAFTLNGPKSDGIDLDLTLDRGRIDLTNLKAAGAARTVVRFGDQEWLVTLDDPAARAAVEVCGRWPAGSRFKLPDAKGGKPETPTVAAVLLVLKGAVTVSRGGITFALSAPPGPAVLGWDSAAGPRPQPLRLDVAPAWAEPEKNLTPAGQKWAAAVEKFRAARAADPDAALAGCLASTDPNDQRVGLITLGATDELVRLGRELGDAKTLQEWDFGVTVLRHWLGRCPGQDQKFYATLVTARGYSPAQAKTVLQLLHGFTPDDLTRPETFEVLIEYLRHDKAGIRNLGRVAPDPIGAVR